MSDLLEAAEALLYVLGSDHSQGEYQTAVDGLVVAVADAGGEIAAPSAALAPGHAPAADEVAPVDLEPADAPAADEVAPVDLEPADAPAAVPTPAPADVDTDAGPDGGSAEAA